MSGRGRHSPYEQGELKHSPEHHKKKKSKKSKKSHHMAPEAKVHVRTADEDDDDVQIIEAADHGEEEGGSLTIKPPPVLLGKHKDKSHKRKKEKHKSKEFGGKGRERVVEKYEPYRDLKPKDPPYMRDGRDAREIVKERKKEREMKEKEIAREMKEREARKREESIKERERLEKMEFERRRERQSREDAAQARQQSRPFTDSRRRDKDRRGDRSSGDHRSRSRDQGKSRDKGHNRPFPPPPRLQEDKPIKRESSSKRSSSSHSRSPEVKVEKDSSLQDTRVVVVDKDDNPKGSGSDRSIDKERDVKREVKEEEEDVEEVEDDSGESDSGSEDSASDSSSDDDDDDSSEEDDDEDGDDEREDVKDEPEDGIKSEEEDENSTLAKLRSKFDDHSDVESMDEGHSNENGSDIYLPESPELSDVELRPEDNLPPYLPAIQGCRSVEEFNCLNRIEEGTYGVVYRALDKKTDEIVALKRLKMEKEKEGFPITSLREINTLLKAQHENIVTVREIVVGSNMDKIYIVMDFVEHDLKSLMERMKNPFLVGEVKTLLRQLLRAVRHMHDNWILHRDLKTSNLLLSHQGILKVGDFGLAREYGSPLRNYTPVVVTLWYRAPELLLGTKEYSTPIDLWSVGCIFAELLLMKALWPGKSEIDQINRIFKDLGTPTEAIWPGMMELPGCKKVTFNQHQYNVVRNRFGAYFTDLGFDLMNKLFTYDPSKRISAEDALQHEYFAESPLPVDPSMFPTWPARSEEGRKHDNSPKPPSGGKAYQKLMDDEEHLTGAGFHMPSAARGAAAHGMGFALKSYDFALQT